jgi:diguanylate cyclase (GGDEF)-like protein
MAIWYLAIGPAVSAFEGSWLTRTLTLAYPAGDLVLLLGVVRVLLRRPVATAASALTVLGCGLLCLVVADVVFAHLDVTGTYSPGSLPDAMWAIAFLFVALAAHLADAPSTAGTERLEQRRDLSVLPFAAIFVGLGLLVYQASEPSEGSLLLLSVGVFGIASLVVARQVTMHRDITSLVGELTDLVRTDPLTGLASRRAFFQDGTELLARAQSKGRACAIVLSDIDDFKLVNDQHGHAAGDAVLRAVAASPTQLLAPGDLAGRLGGDEYAFVLANRGVDAARRFADAFALHVAGIVVVAHSGLPVRTSVSFGIAVSDGVMGLADLLVVADMDLYRAKHERQVGRSPLRSAETAPSRPAAGARVRPERVPG